MTQTQASADAQLRNNGLDVTSPTNTLTDTVQGLTINLLQPTTGVAQITVTQDNEALKKSVDTFVESYNALAKMLRTLWTDYQFIDGATADRPRREGCS